jgi:hypothetical protein
MYTIDPNLPGWSRRKSYAMIRKTHIAPDNVRVLYEYSIPPSPLKADAPTWSEGRLQL